LGPLGVNERENNLCCCLFSSGDELGLSCSFRHAHDKGLAYLAKHINVVTVNYLNVKAYRCFNLDNHFLKALKLDVDVLSLASLCFQIMEHPSEFRFVCWIISKDVDAHQGILLDQFTADH
jgi:hypothetical protein